MTYPYTAEELSKVESMLLKEIEINGRIMVRSIDKIHARTGMAYAAVSEIARRLQEQGRNEVFRVLL